MPELVLAELEAAAANTVVGIVGAVPVADARQLEPVAD